MRKPLRLLMVEDSEDDAALLLRELRRNGYEPAYTRVETSEQMNAALDAQKWDVITSDYSMPDFSAPKALEIMKRKSIDLPFIIVSGTIGEDYAVSALKAGAHDFVVKGAMSRLVPAIEREIREAEVRRARENAEAALLRYAKEVTDLYDNAPCGYHSLDGDGFFVRINNTELSWLGYTRDEIIGKKTFGDVLTPDSSRAFQATFDQFRKKGAVNDLEFDMVRKDGTVIPVLFSAASVKDASGNYIMSRSIVFNNTEHKRLEEQLRQSQKMEAIGQLAGGVAHDFNNLLTVIIGHSLLGLERMELDGPMRATLEQIHRTGERAAALTRQLLAFSRRQIMEPKILNLNSVLADMDEMLTRLTPANVRIVKVLSPDVGNVKVDSGQIEQVILNLVINARDAIPMHGIITIETANVDLNKSYNRPNDNGAYVMLSVSDTGCGMPPEVKARIFEPFYTTKDQGKGTGLGLSTVYGIVKQSDGQIDVYSEVGKGTTIKVYLPRVEGEIIARQSQQSMPAVGMANELILLVEDDEAVREVVHDMLKLYGYNVLLANDGTDALAISATYIGEIDLLITDMVMPKMTGPELAERMQRARPGIKVLFMSGYTESAAINSNVLTPEMNFINKPFSPDAVARKIRDVLSGADKSKGE